MSTKLNTLVSIKVALIFSISPAIPNAQAAQALDENTRVCSVLKKDPRDYTIADKADIARGFRSNEIYECFISPLETVGKIQKTLAASEVRPLTLAEKADLARAGHKVPKSIWEDIISGQ